MRPQALDRLYRMFFISPDVLSPLNRLDPIRTHTSASQMTFGLGDYLELVIRQRSHLEPAA